ncbi:MAG TPA: hypothetical protein ENO23_07275 [Alphaproteobacteria bacterium]|nr:hypothetical protein [Alphaproteobacteria bacterium]
MGNRIEEYREALRRVEDIEAFLLAESRLPGPRGNLELAQAVAEEGSAELFHHLRAFDAERAPVNTPQEFLAFCGVLGLGRLIVEGETEAVAALRVHATDPRWRTREAVAMALQRWGRDDPTGLMDEMQEWSRGSYLVQRAAVAALCEPSLLHDAAFVRRVLALLDSVTAALAAAPAGDRRSDEFKALRKGLGYGWSVAVVALPLEGKRAMTRWLQSTDKDVTWVMRENLKKARMGRMDAGWVAEAQQT